MKTIPFTKMSGAGNDFIVIDNRDNLLPEVNLPFLKSICQRRVAIGADGVLLLEKSANTDVHFKMRYFNSDGNEAEMCGNGGRCIARFAYLNKAAPKKLKFETLAGVYPAEVIGENVKLSMRDPYDIELDIPITIDNQRFSLHKANTGVPHVVSVQDGVAGFPVVSMGRKIRNHAHFQPSGTNVNFVSVNSRSAIVMRTYERGVEDETYACGTGAVAAALLLSLLDKVDFPVTVMTRGGFPLTIHGVREVSTVTTILLEGNAEIIYTGMLPYS